eukprot:m.80314 g.80314  ORF g.80314 m.80314 type:complete len:301 (+) comp14202_c3_seq1:92-994(+)
MSFIFQLDRTQQQNQEGLDKQDTSVNQPSSGKMTLPTAVAEEKSRRFFDNLNAGNFEKATEIYADNCLATVNGGTDKGGFSGASRKDMTEFFRDLVEKKGGKNLKLLDENIQGNSSVHVWECDAGKGRCNLEWKEINNDWFIVKQDSTFQETGKDKNLPEQVAEDKMHLFSDAINAGDYDKATSVYAEDCLMTVNGGVEKGGMFTGHGRREIADFLRDMREHYGGTNFKSKTDRVDGTSSYYTWECDAGTGNCELQWKFVDNDWFVAKEMSSFNLKDDWRGDKHPNMQQQQQQRPQHRVS